LAFINETNVAGAHHYLDMLVGESSITTSTFLALAELKKKNIFFM